MVERHRRRQVEDHDVGLHRGQVELHRGTGGQPLGKDAGVGMVLGQAIDDHVANLDRATIVLARDGADEGSRGAAVAEVFRAVHSLKGAARAVGYESLERFLHGLVTEEFDGPEPPPPHY